MRAITNIAVIRAMIDVSSKPLIDYISHLIKQFIIVTVLIINVCAVRGCGGAGVRVV